MSTEVLSAILKIFSHPASVPDSPAPFRYVSNAPKCHTMFQEEEHFFLLDVSVWTQYSCYVYFKTVLHSAHK